MKLYRGLKSLDYREFDSDLEKELRDGWREVLSLRESGDFIYPENLNKRILKLESISNLTHQNFTDNREIAYSYARNGGGLFLEVEVSMEDLLRYFKMEFQNFSKRRKKFELVYVVSAADLSSNRSKWNLKITKFEK